jgi:hypothetical protein
MLNGPVPILVPQPVLTGLLQLSPAANRWEMLMTSPSGEPALALQAWRTLYETGEYELAAPSLEGCRLLLRPDLFEDLFGWFGARLTWREHLSMNRHAEEPAGAEQSS